MLRNKTDRADALGLTHIMRTGRHLQTHIKRDGCERLRLLLMHQRKFSDVANAIRRSLCGRQMTRRCRKRGSSARTTSRAGNGGRQALPFSRKAVVAVARKLAVIVHAIWIDGTFYCGARRT
jgi:hypothetical protein